MENHLLFQALYRWVATVGAMVLLGLNGCAMFEIPTLEPIRPTGAVNARRDLTSPDAAKRAAAARALGESGAAGAVAQADVMKALIEEQDPEAAVALAWTLRTWKADLAPALDALRRVINQPDHFWRYQAALLISPYVDVLEVAPVYLDTVGTWAEKNLRNKPVVVLADLVASDGPRLVGLLESAASRTNPHQRAAAAKLFSDYRPLPHPGKNVILKLMADPEPVVREAAAHAALMSVPTLDEAGPGLLKLLGDPEAAVRAEAASAIGPLVARGVAPAGALDALAKGMSDPDAGVRESTALSLGHVGALPDGVARPLMARLDPLVEPSAEVRATAAAGLARAPATDELKKALRQALGDHEEQVRVRAMATVGHAQLRDPELLAIVLSRTTASTPKGQRLTAIGCLNDLQWKRDDILAVLQRLSLDPDMDIREAATFAIRQVQAGTP